MTVSSNTSTATFIGNGASVFAVPFRFFDNADVFVYRVDPVTGAATPQVEGVDYSLTGAGEPEVDGNATGQLTLASPLAVGSNLYLERIMPIEQLTDIANQGRFFPEVHEGVFDRLTMLIQQAMASLKGAIRVAVTDPEPARLPPASSRANQLMGFNALGDPIAVAPISGDINDFALRLADGVNPANGSNMVGHRQGDGSATTVRAELLGHESDIDALQADMLAAQKDLYNVPAGWAQLTRAHKNVTSSLLGVSPINILGDSISHGAFGLNLFTNGYVNILKRMTNAEFDISGNGGLGDSSSYGFVPWVIIGSGPTLSTDIHDANAAFVGWVVLTNAAAPDSLSGAQVRSTASGSVIDFSVPTFQAKMRLFYMQQPGGGTFDIVRVSPALVETVITSVNTAGTLDRFKFVDVPITDNGRGSFRYRVKSTSSGQIDMTAGASYIANVERSVVNNFSNSGRRLVDVSEDVIRECIKGAQLFILALNHNDALDAESTPSYFADFQQRMDWVIQYANTYGTPVLVNDFCWDFPASNKVRNEIRRVLTECNGQVVDFPGHFRIDGNAPSATELITTLNLFVDAAHPNVIGHQIVAETIAKALGLSCSSKREALEQFDWWMPLALDGGANVVNTDTGHRLVSSAKRSAAGIITKVRIREAAGANPFPTGIRNIQAAWPTKYGFNLQSIQSVSSGIEYVLTTGALATQCNVSAGGQVRINQLVTNNQDVVGSLISPAI